MIEPERCTFCFDYDPATLTPRGRKCGQPGVELLHWKDGRVSVACAEHGVDALTEDARGELDHVAPLTGPTT